MFDAVLGSVGWVEGVGRGWGWMAGWLNGSMAGWWRVGGGG